MKYSIRHFQVHVVSLLAVGALTLLTVDAHALTAGWTKLVPSNSPPPGRVDASAVYDGSTNRMIVFGGNDNVGNCGTGCVFNDVWILDNANGTAPIAPSWTMLSPAGDPSHGLPGSRWGHTANYDSANNRVIVYGGNQWVGFCGGNHGDVWVLENANGAATPAWHRLSPIGPIPPARRTHTATYDPASNRLIVIGGDTTNCGGVANDVWILESANGIGTPTWIPLTPAGTPPSPFFNHNAVYDASNNRVIVWRTDVAPQQLWVLEHANGLGGTPTWVQVPYTGSIAQFAPEAIYDAGLNTMVTFGGFNSTGRINDVWTLDNANVISGTPNWAQLIADPDPIHGLPPIRDSHTVTYDASTRRMTIFGGTMQNLAVGDDLNDAWVLALSPTTPVNQPPVANAGPDQAIRAGDMVNLDGSASFDDNTASGALSYAWRFFSKPGSSTATLASADTATPSFVADVAGTYAVELVVTDAGGLASAPDQVEVGSDNLAPTAAAGDDQLVIIGTQVVLDGSGSSDPEFDPLTFDWMITSAPPGSSATVSNPGMETAGLLPDMEGVYEVALTVSDFIGAGTPDSVKITATTAQDFAENRIMCAADIVSDLGPDQVTTTGNQTAFLNFLSQAVVAVQKGDAAQAIDKLDKSIERTDGCETNARPDDNGPGRDWITDCPAQAKILSCLTEALGALAL